MPAKPKKPRSKRKKGPPEVVHGPRVVGYFLLPRDYDPNKPGGLYYCTDCVTYLDYLDSSESWGGPADGPMGTCATCGKPEPVCVRPETPK